MNASRSASGGSVAGSPMPYVLAACHIYEGEAQTSIDKYNARQTLRPTPLPPEHEILQTSFAADRSLEQCRFFPPSYEGI